MKSNITFIIVTWNNEDTIIECLDSIYKYSNNFNILIIDNNSSDKTVEIIESKKYNNCKVIASKENYGFAKGNNVALDMVDTKYICYLNPDTVLLEDIIVPSINVLRKNKDVGIVGSKLLYKNLSLQQSTFNFDSSKQIFIENMRIGKLFPNFIKEKYFPNCSKCKKDKYVDWIIGAEMILKTCDAKKINGFSTDYYMYVEDMDICKKMNYFLNKKCYYLSSNSLIHIGGVSEAKNVNYKKMKLLIRNKLLFVKKYYSLSELKKSYIVMKLTYKIRYLFSYFLLPISKNKYKYYSDKMKNGYQYTIDAYNEIME